MRHEDSPCLGIRKKKYSNTLHPTPKSAQCANAIDLIQSLWQPSQECHQYETQDRRNIGQGQDFSAWVSADPD